MTNDLRKMAEAATPEAIAKRLRDRALRMEGDPDGVVGNATWLANTAANIIDALTARIRELEASNATAFAAGIEAAADKLKNRAFTLTYESQNVMVKAILHREWDRAIDEIRALSPSPEMVMVPAEATDAMLKAGAIAFYGSKKDVLAARLPEAYRAMIEAATGSKE